MYPATYITCLKSPQLYCALGAMRTQRFEFAWFSNVEKSARNFVLCALRADAISCDKNNRKLELDVMPAEVLDKLKARGIEEEHIENRVKSERRYGIYLAT